MRLFKFCRWLLPIVLLWYSNHLFAQKHQNLKLYLRNGMVEPPANLSGNSGRAAFRENVASELGRLVIVQFNSIPDERSVAQLKNAGIKLLEYIPDYAYSVVLRAEPDVALLNSVNARAIIELEPAQKIHPVLTGASLPAHVVKVAGKLDVRISYPRSVPLAAVKEELAKQHFEIISSALGRYRMLDIRLEKDRLQQLAALPWLQYVEAGPGPAMPLNDKSAAATRANMLAVGLPSGVKLDGQGVTIGIGDIGNPFEHADLTGRLASAPRQGSYWHGLHVAGTAAGAGIVNEKYQGYAPKANIVFQSNDEIWENAPTLVKDFGMVVTNNSWGSMYGGSSCRGFGAYSSVSYVIDRQAEDLPELQNIFAAGNSGIEASCHGFPAGFGNVHGDFASAKSTISVGRTAQTGLISASSSKGPTQDGRIKPDLVAPGTSIFSTMPGDQYDDASGTSMAAPAVTGGAALLYQRYRQLHQQNPRNALVKALLCNGATDKGLPGPDFNYGFGLMNLLRSVTMIEKGHYFTGTLVHQEAKEMQITVPAGMALVKVMLYWNDRAESILAGSKALINDLDLKAIKPDSISLFPLVPNPAAPAAAAVAGLDTINNVEQIVIENPAAGTYTLKVTGSKIPSGPQEFFLVYDMIEKSTVLTYPVGTEHFTKGDGIYISWDSYGNPNSTFAVSYSLNNGATWTAINTAVPAGTNQLSWTVPDAFTASAKIRLVQNETGIVKESGAFSIMGVPVITLAPVQCEGYAALQWSAVNGASDYEVMRLQGSEMKAVSVTTTLKYTFSGLSRDSTYYFSVRPRLNGIPGRRAVAIKRKPDSGTCAGGISDNDIGIDSIVSPAGSGRMLTSSGLSGIHPIIASIHNFDDQPITRPFEVGYSIGAAGAPVHWETVNSGLPGLGRKEYTFGKTADLQAAGTYKLNFFVKLDGDPVQANNQKAVEIGQVANPSVTLPYLEDFESLPPQTLQVAKSGLGKDSRYDFTLQNDIARLRTNFGPEMAYSGEKALTFDADNWNYDEYSTSVTGTYNLANYDARSEDIRLTFRFRKLSDFYQHEGDVGVYVRGKDTDSWIFAFDYNSAQYLPSDEGFLLGTVQISELLRKNAQNYSTSFQVMWRQKSSYPAPDDGYVIDDIRLFTTRSDLELARIVQSPQSVCTDGERKLSVVVKNSGEEDFYNLPLLVTVDGNEAYKDTIPVVRAAKDLLYTFNFYSNLNVEGDHVIKAQVFNAFDTTPANNSLQIGSNTPPVISSIPYLEDFENGPGGWQTIDANSSWQFGRPSAVKIKDAASGANAWKTNLTGTYQNDSISYLYSPCLNFLGRFGVSVSFSFSIDPAACGEGNCNIADVEYTDGWDWYKLYTVNWGNPQDRSRWRVTAVGLPGYAKRMRFAVKGSRNATEGIAIDNIHFHDNGSSVFDYPLLADQEVKQNVQGDSWTDFKVNMQMVASIQANGQDLGEVSARTYIDYGTRQSNGFYYPERTYKFTTSRQSFPKPVGVRLYFSDLEMQRFLAAPDQPGVSKPESAYDLAVTQYSGINEDGDLTNNADKVWSYYPNSAIKIVPYLNGYFVEFQTKTFSEFWLAKGFLGLGDPMPVTLATFSAKKQLSAPENRQSVLLEWQTAQEKDFSHFEIEVARDKESLLKKLFSKIGEVHGKGGNNVSPSYSFTDNFPATTGASYYRLKMVDIDGSFEYSAIRPVNFDGEKEWKVFPNPAEKRIFVEFEEKAGKVLKFSISDAGGRIVFADDVIADGSTQKKEIDVSSAAVLPGVYVLKVVSEDRERVFKIIKK